MLNQGLPFALLPFDMGGLKMSYYVTLDYKNIALFEEFEVKLFGHNPPNCGSN